MVSATTTQRQTQWIIVTFPMRQPLYMVVVVTHDCGYEERDGCGGDSGEDGSEK